MRIHELLRYCLDFIFPPSNDVLRVRTLTSDDVLSHFSLQQVHDVRALSHYGHRDIRALIHEAKFHYSTKAYTLLNVLLLRYLAQRNTPLDIIIPIPLSPARMRKRGYNQVLEILRPRGSKADARIDTKILKRNRNTRPQTELKREERLTNIEDAFGVVHGARVTGKHVLIVDDVSTTGATLSAAKAALLPHRPSSVTCLALAH